MGAGRGWRWAAPVAVAGIAGLVAWWLATPRDGPPVALEPGAGAPRVSEAVGGIAYRYRTDAALDTVAAWYRRALPDAGFAVSRDERVADPGMPEGWRDDPRALVIVRVSGTRGGEVVEIEAVRADGETLVSVLWRR